MTSNNKGFSLLEVLIAMIVLALGVVGLMKLQTYMEVKSENALTTIDALYLAEEKLEQFQTRSQSAAVGTILYSSIVGGTETLSISGKPADRIVTVVDDTPVVGAKKVTVTVSWNDRWDTSQQVSLETVISKFNEFDD